VEGGTDLGACGVGDRGLAAGGGGRWTHRMPWSRLTPTGTPWYQRPWALSAGRMTQARGSRRRPGDADLLDDAIVRQEVPLGRPGNPTEPATLFAFLRMAAVDRKDVAAKLAPSAWAGVPAWCATDVA
jgi:hypothetical protein